MFLEPMGGVVGLVAVSLGKGRLHLPNQLVNFVEEAADHVLKHCVLAETLPDCLVQIEVD